MLSFITIIILIIITHQSYIHLYSLNTLLSSNLLLINTSYVLCKRYCPYTETDTLGLSLVDDVITVRPDGFDDGVDEWFTEGDTLGLWLGDDVITVEPDGVDSEYIEGGILELPRGYALGLSNIVINLSTFRYITSVLLSGMVL